MAGGPVAQRTPHLQNHISPSGVAEGLSVTRKQAGDRWLCLWKAAINTWGSAGSSGLGRDWGPGRVAVLSAVAPSNPKIPRDLPGGGFSRHRRSGPTWVHHSHHHHRKSAALRSGFRKRSIMRVLGPAPEPESPSTSGERIWGRRHSCE